MMHGSAGFNSSNLTVTLSNTKSETASYSNLAHTYSNLAHTNATYSNLAASYSNEITKLNANLIGHIIILNNV
jgi:hypothetical protein